MRSYSLIGTFNHYFTRCLVRWLSINTSSYNTEAVVHQCTSLARHLVSICSSRKAGNRGGGQGTGAVSSPAPGACDGAVSTAQLSRAHSRVEAADGGSGGSRYVSVLLKVNWGERFDRGILNDLSSYAPVYA